MPVAILETTEMMFPILSVDEAAAYEVPDAVANAFLPGLGMSCRDSWARAMGHADEWESDEMGAAASVYRLDATDRRGLAWCAVADGGLLGPVADGPWAYIRSDDRGFWDIQTGTETECREWLTWWVAANVPTYCERCETMLDRETVMTVDGYRDEYPADGLCGDCIEEQYETDRANAAPAAEPCEVCTEPTTDHDGFGYRCSHHGPRGGLADELRAAERGE